MRPEIYSSLKIDKFCDFTLQDKWTKKTLLQGYRTQI